jgi:hypothetical protein
MNFLELVVEKLEARPAGTVPLHRRRRNRALEQDFVAIDDP